MSGIYISGMKMPKSCGECKFFAWKRGVGNHCAIDESITFHPTLDGLDVRYEKNGNCPFIAVPDHGRLIDADAIDWVEGRDEQDRPVYLLLKVQIDDIPTIISAEGDET